ncbi:unnamed protein product, partial [Symbiodinium sp. KB8]
GVPEAALASLNLSHEDLDRLRAHALEPPALRQAGADAWTEAVSHCVTDGTFFLIRGDTVAVSTHRGTRPGSSWADILFAAVMQRVLRRRDELRNGLLYPTQAPKIPWDGQRVLTPCEPGASTHDIDDVVWADDLATMRRQLFGPRAGSGELKVLLEGAGAATVPLVSHYKHLGTMQGPKGGLSAEIAYRTSQAFAAYNEGRRKVYRARAIPPHRKAFILRTAVIPKLTFGCGAWSPLTSGDYKKFAGCLWRLYRSLLCLRRDQEQDLSFHTCLSLVGLPSPLNTLRMHRLLYIGQILCGGPDALWALIRTDSGYLEQAMDAFRWLHSLVGPQANLPPPDTGWE